MLGDTEVTTVSGQNVGAPALMPTPGGLHMFVNENPMIFFHPMHSYDLELGANDYAIESDAPNDDFAGTSMNVDGSGGYLSIGTRDTAPFDTFQLLKVGQIGGNVTVSLSTRLRPKISWSTTSLLRSCPRMLRSTRRFTICRTSTFR